MGSTFNTANRMIDMLWQPENQDNKRSWMEAAQRPMEHGAWSLEHGGLSLS